MRVISQQRTYSAKTNLQLKIIVILDPPVQLGPNFSFVVNFLHCITMSTITQLEKNDVCDKMQVKTKCIRGKSYILYNLKQCNDFYETNDDADAGIYADSPSRAATYVQEISMLFHLLCFSWIFTPISLLIH